MISTPDFQSLGERVLDAMDREILLLSDKCREMEQLLSVIVARDNGAMEKVLDVMERAQQEQERLDGELERLTVQLAAEAGCPKSKPRLSELVRYLPRALGRALDDRRQALTAGLRRLRQKHMEVSLLLHECRKINRMMLDCLMRETAAPRTYGADGSLRQHAGGGVMSAEL